MASRINGIRLAINPFTGVQIGLYLSIDQWELWECMT